MKKLAFLLLAAIMAFSCAPKQDGAKAPVKFIIETDMGNDIDDALALTIALRAVDEGKAELLAVGCHKLSASPAAFCDAVCTWYGHPGIPAAMSLTPVKETSDYVGYTVVEKDFPKSDTEYPEPVALYRRILSEQPDHSVTFISLGFGTTLAQLLESGPDDISPLSGVDLVAKKTVGLSVMCGSYGSKATKIAEYNVRNDIPAMKTVFEKWPTKIWQNPGEIGEAVLYPCELIEKNLGYDTPNPVAEAYKHYRDWLGGQGPAMRSCPSFCEAVARIWGVRAEPRTENDRTRVFKGLETHISYPGHNPFSVNTPPF